MASLNLSQKCNSRGIVCAEISDYQLKEGRCMKLKKSSLLVTAVLLGATVMPVQANNEAMLNLLKVLRDQGTITAENYNLLVDAAKADKEAAKEVEEKITKVEKESTTVSLKGGHLKIKSADKAFSAQIGGRVMADYAIINDDINDRGNGSELRRARVFQKVRHGQISAINYNLILPVIVQKSKMLI